MSLNFILGMIAFFGRTGVCGYPELIIMLDSIAPERHVIYFFFKAYITLSFMHLLLIFVIIYQTTRLAI